MFGPKRLARKRLWGAAAALLTLAAGSLAGCSNSGTATAAAAAQTGAGKPVLTMGLTNYTSTLNPAIAGGGDQSMPIDLAYASLTHLEPNGDIGAGLATSWHYVGTTNTEFTVTLRQDARFSDGTPVTASAVKAWLDYAYFKAKGYITSSLALKSVSTSGNWTVTLHLSQPNSEMPYLLSEAEMFGFIGSPTTIAHASELGTQTDGAGTLHRGAVAVHRGKRLRLQAEPVLLRPVGGALLQGGREDHHLADHHDRGDQVGPAQRRRG